MMDALTYHAGQTIRTEIIANEFLTRVSFVIYFVMFMGALQPNLVIPSSQIQQILAPDNLQKCVGDFLGDFFWAHFPQKTGEKIRRENLQKVNPAARKKSPKKKKSRSAESRP